MQHRTSYARETFYIPNAPVPSIFLENLPEYFETHGAVIHQARNLIKVFEHEGQALNVKKYCIPPIVNRILYSLGWRTPKAKTTFLNAQEILKRGFLTPKPFGYLIERNAGLINYSYFISEQVTDFKPIGHHCHNKELIKALACYTADLHQKGLLHKDYTPGNILYRVQNGVYSFMLVDINRFRFRNKPVSTFDSVCNLMKPFDDDETLKFFVSEYTKCRCLNNTVCTAHVLFWRHLRNAYDKIKHALKRLPGANWLLQKPIQKK